MGAVPLAIWLDGQFQPEAIKQPPQHVKRWIALAGFNVAECVNRDLSQLCEILLSNAEALPPLPESGRNNRSQALRVHIHLSE